ncbi:hypothetical protein F4820DRAFT_352534 [Hypoxylon rubiginosum]|uniref:Uncharacterized protein n=1 Tax=Hypoxylon rubiginosum TaxID=110542 RepID=A0ACB9YX36_9PEZI|nr:hypothetical protein F4820DRAFT_352534 [Hypoxylon rubiginosum]
MQSALVLINQLHRTTESYDEKIMDNLKFAFTILRMTENFYAPAHEWIETLFRVHDTNTPLRHHSETVDAAFHNYFSRFVGVDEPGFVTVYPKEITESQHASVHQTLVHSDPPVHEEPTNGEAPDEQNGGRSWLQSYVNHLEENISDDESGMTPPQGILPPNRDRGNCEDEFVRQPDGLQLMSFPPVDASISAADPLPEITVADNDRNNSSNGSWQTDVLGGELDSLYAQFGDINYVDGSNSGGLDVDVWSAMMDRVLGGNEQWAGILANGGDLFQGQFGR